MRALVISMAALVAAGCTAVPPAPERDETPTHPTAVIETHVTSNGLKGLFPLEMDEHRYVREHMSREENAMKGTGTFSGFLINAFGPNDDAIIERLDRKVRWTLDRRKKQYTECPLQGCSAPREARAVERQKQQPQEKREPDCVMSVAKKRFTVKATGEKRDINGFDASEYRVAWIVTLRDKKGRSSTSSLRIETWTTPLSPSMREALELDHAYARARAGAVHEARGISRDLSQPVPPEVTHAMLAYIGQLSASDRAELLSVGKRLERIKGYAVRSRIDWDFEGNACGESGSKSSSRGGEAQNSVASGLANLFSGGAQRDKPKEDEPLFSFTYEIRAMKIEPVHDGMFTVPQGYRRVVQ